MYYVNHQIHVYKACILKQIIQNINTQLLCTQIVFIFDFKVEHLIRKKSQVKGFILGTVEGKAFIHFA